MIGYFFKIFFWKVKQLRKDEKIYKSNDYYKDINLIPLFNWWKCAFDSDYSYMWKERQEYVPEFFKNVFVEISMDIDYLDLKDLREEVQLNVLKNKYLTTKDIKYKRKYQAKKAEIEQLKTSEKVVKLNDYVLQIQKALNLNWMIDPMKISAGYFFTLVNQLRNGNN